MKNPLNRRLPRELKGEMGKYMVIFLFMMLTIGFTSGYFVANSSMLQASEESYDKYNIEDGHFVVKDEISASLQRKLEQEDVKIYKDFYKEEAVDTDNDGKSDGSIRVFAEREKVNLICVMKGSMPTGKAEIAVDRMYADNNDIAVGDTICIGNSKKKVSGYVALSDYSALFSDNSDMMFDATKFGVAVMTKQGYDSLAKEHENYQYDWKYNTAPKDKKQEQKQSEDFINALAEKTFQAGVTISLALPAYANQAIHFASDDIGGDMGMMIALLYILIAIMAFVFSVTIRHTITRESAVIGTLRASGYTKGELMRHYLAVPMTVTFLACALGNVLGYTYFKGIVADMYYGSYSLPTYVTIWNAKAFVITTVVPLIIMLIVNVLSLQSKLQLSPLRFLRRDLDCKKKKKATRLPKWSFFNRFRIRVITQNRSSYITLFAGMLFASLLLLFGMMMIPLLSHYKNEVVNGMLADYQYVLKAPVRTSDDQAEKYCMTSLIYKGSKDESISIMGLEQNSKYFKHRLPKDGVMISDSFAEKYGVKKGDTLQLQDEYSGKKYRFRVKETVAYAAGLSVFMDIDKYRDTFDEEVDMMQLAMSYPEVLLAQLSTPEESKYFTGYLSDRKLTDIDEKYVDSCITVDDMTKLSRQLDVSMGAMFQMINVFAVLLAVLLIYLLTKLILERNTTSISMVKILGYENKEIARLYLLATSWVVAFSALVGFAIATLFMTVIYKAIMMQFNGWLTLYYSPDIYPKMFVMIMVSYAVVAATQYHKIQKIPMDEALKNVE